MDSFEQFKAKEKFLADTKLFYPGLSDPSLRPILTEKINLAAKDFQTLANKGIAVETEYQYTIKASLSRFD